MIMLLIVWHYIKVVELIHWFSPSASASYPPPVTCCTEHEVGLAQRN